MGDYDRLNYSESFDSAEIKQFVEHQENQNRLLIKHLQKLKFAIIFIFLIVTTSIGLIIYLHLSGAPSGTISNANWTAPIGTILAWVPKPENTSANVLSIPEGWMPCDGSLIIDGPWEGERTPDLNSIGAFLRGGPEDLVLEMEDSQIEDHEHEDNGHEHSCSASSSSSSHDHGYKAAYSVRDGDTHHGGDSLCAWAYGPCDKRSSLEYDKSMRTGSKSVSVSTSCSLGSATSGMGGVSSGANSGTETRPINMKVMYIIRVF